MKSLTTIILNNQIFLVLGATQVHISMADISKIWQLAPMDKWLICPRRVLKPRQYRKRLNGPV